MFNYKIHIIILLLILVFSSNAMAQNNKFVGNWDGAILVNEQKLNINVTFEMTGNNLIGTIDIPQQNIFDYPLEIENINLEGIDVHKKKIKLIKLPWVSNNCVRSLSLDIISEDLFSFLFLSIKYLIQSSPSINDSSKT